MKDKNKTLLNESTIRRFMKLAELNPLTKNFFDKNVQEEEAVDEGGMAYDRDEELPGEELPGEELPGEELPGEEEEGILLAEPPGNRRDDVPKGTPYTRPGWKGKTHERGHDRRTKTYGAGRSTNKRMKGAASQEMGRPGNRKKFVGDVTRQLASWNGLEEHAESRDLIEERRLFTTSQEVKTLIESLNIGVVKDETKTQ